MKEILKKIGISEKTIKAMEEIFPNINDITEKEILEKIKILNDIGCDHIQIKNIISSNAMYLDRSNTDIEKLINKLKELGFENLDLIFDGNPYVLNLEAFEIEEYVKSREKQGELLEDIVDEISSKLYLLNEI